MTSVFHFKIMTTNKHIGGHNFEMEQHIIYRSFFFNYFESFSFLQLCSSINIMDVIMKKGEQYINFRTIFFENEIIIFPK